MADDFKKTTPEKSLEPVELLVALFLIFTIGLFIAERLRAFLKSELALEAGSFLGKVLLFLQLLPHFSHSHLRSCILSLTESMSSRQENIILGLF